MATGVVSGMVSFESLLKGLASPEVQAIKAALESHRGNALFVVHPFFVE
ncbi:hypothetical protein HY546_03255, partial [archaeon]|nr:hypothetical protein [archaeon]